MEPIKIIDIICNKSAYGRQFLLIVDRMPELIYTREGSRFTSNDSGFYSFKQGTSRVGDAFGGRRFSITLDDGSTFECQGDVWACGPSEGIEPTISVGVATVEKLRECYVFRSFSVSREVVADWLASNRVSRNYNKYRREVSLADYPRYGMREVCAKRARVLRKRGVEVINRQWCPAFERLKAENAALEEIDRQVKVGEVVL